MDVYALILDKGIIGALEYANSVDPSNYRFASKIDKATNSLFKLSQQPMQFVSPVQTTPNVAPQQQAPLQGPTKEITNDDMIRIFGPDIYKQAPMPQSEDWLGVNNIWWNAIKDGLLMGLTPQMSLGASHLLRLRELGPLVQELNNVNLSPLLKDQKIEEIAKIINKSPGKALTQYGNYNVKESILNAVNKNLKNPGDVENVLIRASDLHNVSNNTLQNILRGNNQVSTDFKDLIQQGKVTLNDLKGKSLKELDDILVKNGKVGGALAGTRNLNNLSGQLVADGNKGKIAQMIEKAAVKFPILGKVLPFVAKIAGPLFVALSAKGLIDDWEKLNGQPDAKWYCEFGAIIASILTLIPPLTPFAGPIALALNFGCMFVGRDEKKKSNLMSSDYKARMQTIQEADLSGKDMSMINSLWNEYSSDKKSLQQAFEKSKDSFDNALDAGAYLMKKYKDSGSVSQAPIDSLKNSLTPDQFDLVKNTAMV